jgi:hypothetical protein
MTVASKAFSWNTFGEEKLNPGHLTLATCRYMTCGQQTTAGKKIVSVWNWFSIAARGILRTVLHDFYPPSLPPCCLHGNQ